MGSQVRNWERGVVYSATMRCVDRQFLLAPNHRADNALLHRSCPANALDLSNDIIPVPSTINVVGACVGRALEKFPVNLHFFECNINHPHDGISLGQDHPLDNASSFLQLANGGIARGVNKLLDREGHLWGARARVTPCVDDGAAEQQLFYAMTNPVKDGLVERVKQSPFFSTYRSQALGEEQKYWWLDWNAFYLAGGFRTKSHRVKDYLKWTRVEIAPLPEWADLSVHQRRTRCRRQVRDIEEHELERRRDEGRRVFGVPALFEVDPRGRPKNPKESGKKPECHATDVSARRSYRKRRRDFLREYMKASWDFRNGYWEREFPEGSFRPPIVKVYTDEDS